MKQRHLLLTLATVVLYALHQDIWFWRTARPLVFGFLPIGLFYHACFSVAAALLLGSLVRWAWPGHLDDGIDDTTKGPVGATQHPPANR